MDRDGLAARLIDEHDRNVQFRPFAAANGIASLDDSYTVQERYVSLLKPRCGAPVGYKIEPMELGVPYFQPGSSIARR